MSVSDTDTKIIILIKSKIKNKYDIFKERFLGGFESYCDEMALMYAFTNYLDYITQRDENIDLNLELNIDLNVILDKIDEFVDDFLEIYWNSDLGNSYDDIEKMLQELVREYKNEH